jgi:hypothetical protein
LVLEEFQVAQDVGFDFLWLGLGINLLKLGDDLLDGVVTVAALDDFEAWADEAEGALGHQEDALVVIFAEAAACRQAGTGLQIGCHDF